MQSPEEPRLPAHLYIPRRKLSYAPLGGKKETIYATSSYSLALFQLGDLTSTLVQITGDGTTYTVRELIPGAFQAVFGGREGVIHTVESTDFVCGTDLAMFRMRANEYARAHPSPITITATSGIPDVLEALDNSPDITLVKYKGDGPPNMTDHAARIARTIKGIEQMQAGTVPWRMLPRITSI
jgi:hypothetical protein